MTRGIALSLIAWVCIGVMWFFVTRSFHPTLQLAIIVTTSLMVAYALAVYFNHLYLIPHYWSGGRYGSYAWRLIATMTLLTAATLAVNRTAYFLALGPDPDPSGLYHHYAIDLFGMVLHVSAAAVVVGILHRRPAAPQSNWPKT